jgi:ABC-2 type transport system permease protein
VNVVRLVRTELLKQRTLRLYVAGFVAAPVVAGLVVLAVFGAAGKQGNPPLEPENLLQVVGAPAPVITMLALLLGVLGMAGEYRHQTITTSYLATPRRRDVVVAKLAAHTVTAVAMAWAAVVATLAVAVPWLQSAGVPIRFRGEMVGLVLGLVGSCALHAALGVGIGAIVRNQTAAITVVLVWFLAVEGLLSDVLGGFGRWDGWMPGEAAAGLVTPDGQLLVSALTFLAYVAVAAAAGIALQTRKDIS